MQVFLYIIFRTFFLNSFRNTSRISFRDSPRDAIRNFFIDFSRDSFRIFPGIPFNISTEFPSRTPPWIHHGIPSEIPAEIYRDSFRDFFHHFSELLQSFHLGNLFRLHPLTLFELPLGISAGIPSGTPWGIHPEMLDSSRVFSRDSFRNTLRHSILDCSRCSYWDFSQNSFRILSRIIPENPPDFFRDFFRACL